MEQENNVAANTMVASVESEKKNYAVTIENSILSKIPARVKGALPTLTPAQQDMFVQDFKKKSKSVGVAYLCHCIFFSSSYGYLHKWGMQIFYWLTFGGCLIWYFILLFLLPKKVRLYNEDVAAEVMRDIKIMQ